MAIAPSEVVASIDSIADDQKHDDSLRLIDLMTDVTGGQPAIWEPAMIGFGRWRYRCESGREGDWFFCGFAPRSKARSIYLPGGLGLVSR